MKVHDKERMVRGASAAKRRRVVQELLVDDQGIDLLFCCFYKSFFQEEKTTVYRRNEAIGEGPLVLEGKLSRLRNIPRPDRPRKANRGTIKI